MIFDKNTILNPEDHKLPALLFKWQNEGLNNPESVIGFAVAVVGTSRISYYSKFQDGFGITFTYNETLAMVTDKRECGEIMTSIYGDNVNIWKVCLCIPILSHKPFTYNNGFPTIKGV